MVQLNLNLPDTMEVLVQERSGRMTPVRGRQVLMRDYADTRREAFDRVLGRLGELYALIATAVLDAGVHGLTSDEAARAIDVDRLTVRPRMTELHQAGILEDLGARRKNESGRKAKVYGLTSPANLLALEQRGKVWKGGGNE